MSQQYGRQQPGKFGLMMNSVGSSAFKSMSRAGKSMGKAAVKAKQKAVEKIAKVPISQDDPEIISIESRLKVIKSNIYSISDIARNLYESRVHEATYLSQLSDKLKQIQPTQQNDAFAAWAHKFGSVLAQLEYVISEHIQRMEDEFVKPLEELRDYDLEYVQKLKLKSRDTKTEFDIANHNVTKAQQSGDQMKIQNAQQKAQTATSRLANVRNDMKSQMNTLEQKKQTSLVESLQKYWSSYGAYASAQSKVINASGASGAGAPQKGTFATANHVQNVNRPTYNTQNRNMIQNTNRNTSNPNNRNVNNQRNMNNANRNMNNNTHNQYNDATNRAAMQSVGQNPQVHNAAKSAMQDRNIRSAAFNAYQGRGNDANSNKQLASALGRNKQVQSAGVSVAKDKNVQQAAWNGAKNNANRAYANYNNNNSNFGNNAMQNRYPPQNNYNNQDTFDDDDDDDDEDSSDEFEEEMNNEARRDYNPFD